MHARHTFALVLLLACGRSYEPGGGPTDGGRDAGTPSPDAGRDAGAMPAPDGGAGVCCPVADFEGCNPGAMPIPAGGWAPDPSGCTGTIEGFDGWPFERRVDDRGCVFLYENRDARPCGSPAECEGLGLVACLADRECAPRWDDGCCPTCVEEGEPVACADCFAAAYHGCWERREACSLTGLSCGATPAESCVGGVVDCEGARLITLESCDRYGCIPAYPSGPGPDVERAICVPATAQSCTVACRRAAPPCHAGTVPEGDGFCYTDRCIPAFACE